MLSRQIVRLSLGTAEFALCRSMSNGINKFSPGGEIRRRPCAACPDLFAFDKHATNGVLRQRSVDRCFEQCEVYRLRDVGDQNLSVGSSIKFGIAAAINIEFREHQGTCNLIASNTSKFMSREQQRPAALRIRSIALSTSAAGPTTSHLVTSQFRRFPGYKRFRPRQEESADLLSLQSSLVGGSRSSV